MRHYQIRDTSEYTGGVTVEVWTSNDPTPHPFADYSDSASALRAHADLNWHEVTDQERADDESAGDILYTADIA